MVVDDPLRARYDETPYRDQTFSEFDTARLLGLAEIFGLRSVAAPPADLAVLDLACASGAHLREQAALYPNVRFTGVDFSAQEIEMGRKEVQRAGLSNVELVHADLRSFDVEPEGFDVILCHGAFSWVPDEVKDRILQLCRAGLKRSGLAAIAYLTYPGWKQKEALRELLAMRVRGIAEPEARIRESALVLRFLHAGYSAHDGNPHAASLKAVVEQMQHASTNVFLHDELGDVNDPCYFLQFAEWAEECGLDYLAEADLGSMSAGRLVPSTAGLLQALSPDFLESQQLLDFVVNRAGRSSLLVRSDAAPVRSITCESLEGLCFSTRWIDVTPLNADPQSRRSFESERGERIELDNPAREELERFSDRDGGGDALLRLVAGGLAEARARITTA
jgi:SAM-dependent methyltransferase